MVKSKRDKPANPKNADVEILFGAKAEKLRFEQVPETTTTFPGDSEKESASGSDRENLPEKVEPGVTYRKASIQWRAAARLSEDESEPGGRDVTG